MSEPELLGRRSECAALQEVVVSVRAGGSRALALRGEAGVGKSALLEYLVQYASRCSIARAAGVESEMELAFAGLHQLCAPFVQRLERLPGPQRDALGTAFGLRDGGAPDRFLVGLAVLSLLSDIAEERPLICVLDDAQWLDEASAQALAIVARRLGAESVGLVFAVREPTGARHLEGLDALVVRGLDDRDARALLDTVITGPLDARVRDRIVAETRGNPLALLELPRGRTPAELAGGFGMTEEPTLSEQIEKRFRERLAPLPPPTRLLLLVAAAEPAGDPLLVWRAAAELGTTNHLVAGVGVFALSGAAAVAQLVLRRTAPWAGAAGGSLALSAGMVLLVVAAKGESSVTYLAAAVIGGAGFGVAFLGALRALTTVIPPEHRAAVMSAFYVVAYAALSLPAIAGGILVSSIGVLPTFEVFGTIVAALALVVASQAWRTRPLTHRTHRRLAYQTTR
jgi:hypothetical protein